MNKYLKYAFIPILGILIFYYGFYIVESETVTTENKRTLKAAPSKKRVSKKKIPLPELNFRMPEKDALNILTAKVVGLTEKDLDLRNMKVWKLRKENLTKADFEAFYSFLKSNPEKPGAQLGLHSIKNDLLVFIIDDGRYKESTAALMLDIINDPNQHDVMKEYTIQYIPDYFEKHWLVGVGKNQQESKEISNLSKEFQNQFIDSMWKMTRTKNGPVPGTALIRLHELSRNFKAIDSKRVEEETEKMISDQTMSTSGRMAALSIAAERKLSHISKYSSLMTFDESLPISLRLAAMNTTIMLTEDDTFIEVIKSVFLNDNSIDNRLRRAVVLITKKLQKKRG